MGGEDELSDGVRKGDGVLLTGCPPKWTEADRRIPRSRAARQIGGMRPRGDG